MMDGSYPSGVAGYMLDDYFRDGDAWQCCGNCAHYNGTYCTKLWNNMDEDYCVPERDKKEEDDCCEDHEYDEEG